jgi:hypothetical protein
MAGDSLSNFQSAVIFQKIRDAVALEKGLVQQPDPPRRGVLSKRECDAIT